MYGLAAARIALVILMAIRWAESGRDRDFYLAIFTFALSLSNHLVLAAVAPALVAFVLISRPQTVRVRTILIGAAASLASYCRMATSCCAHGSRRRTSRPREHVAAAGRRHPSPQVRRLYFSPSRRTKCSPSTCRWRGP